MLIFAVLLASTAALSTGSAQTGEFAPPARSKQFNTTTLTLTRGKRDDSWAAAQQVLADHNRLRARHGASPLTLDGGLSNAAANHAQSCAYDGSLYHSDSGYGENLAAGYEPGSVTDGWSSEESDYDYNNPQYSPNTGHFTQIVWKSSRRLGVGFARGADGMLYTVAYYSPPGNVQGQFRANVSP